MTSNAMVRKALEKTFPDGKELQVSDIKELLRTGSGMTYGVDYTEGNLAGVLRMLTCSGKLTKIERGIYKKAEEVIKDVETKAETKNGTSCSVKGVLKKYEEEREKIKEITKEMETILENVSLRGEVTDADFDTLKNIISFQNALTAVLKKFEK